MQIARGVLTVPSKNSISPLTFSKRVFTEISQVVRRSNIRWRGRSFAASVPSDIPKSHRSRKKVSKDERQALVESFVNKYKELNAGKFPTASNTRKQVGGSYYSVRMILQELVYKSKISPIKKSNANLLGKEIAKENESLTVVEEVSSSQMTVDAGTHKDSQTVAINDVDIGDARCKQFQAKEGSQTTTFVEKTLSEEVEKPTTTGDHYDIVSRQSQLLKGKIKEVSHPFHEKPKDGKKEEASKPKDGKKEEVSSVDLLNFDGPKPKVEQHQGSPELEKFPRDISRNKTDDEELPKKSSVWGNLKSITDGIINIWRKL